MTQAEFNAAMNKWLTDNGGTYNSAYTGRAIDDAVSAAIGAAKADLTNVLDADFATKAISAGVAGRTFVLEITFAETLSGSPFTVSGGGFTFSGTVPAGLIAQVDVPIPNTIYTVACGADFSVVSTTNCFGIYPVNVGLILSVFADNSWETIGRAIAENTVPATWVTESEKDIALTTGETLTMQIYGPDHDDLADGSGKAKFTLGLKNLMTEMRPMNSTNTNSGGFAGSEMHDWLRNTLFPTLPADLRAIIKPVYKNTSAGNQSTTILTESMDIFPFAAAECMDTSNSVPGEGTQYPIFTDNASRVKRLSNGAGATTPWWTRSPNGTNNSSFVRITAGGGVNYPNASVDSGVCFGFSI